MYSQQELEQLKNKNEQLRKNALIDNIKDYSTFCDQPIHPSMDISLMNEKELKMAHLYCHNSNAYKVPKYGKEAIVSFHNKIVNEMNRRGKNHLFVDSLDKIYK